MNISDKSGKRILLTSGVLLVLIAVLIASIVIPSVKAFVVFSERAVPAFWINIGFQLFVGLIFTGVAISKKRRKAHNHRLAGVGVIVLLLGLALFSAASAYQNNGPSMHSAIMVLFITGGINCLVAIAVSLVAFLPPKKKYLPSES